MNDKNSESYVKKELVVTVVEFIEKEVVVMIGHREE